MSDDSIAFLTLMGAAVAFYAFACGFLFVLGKTYQLIAGVLV
jgi:hypothetical protein